MSTTINPASKFPQRTWETLNVCFRNFNQDYVTGAYNLEPEHQRGVVHNIKWKQGIIRSSCEYNDIPPVRFHTRFMENGTQTLESLDGKQRCMAILGFMKDEFGVFFPELGYNNEKTYSELNLAERQFIDNRTLDIKITRSTLTNDEISVFFQRAQQTKVTLLGEHLNSDVGSDKRSIAKNAMAQPNIKDLLNKIKPNKDRFSHLEIMARLLYCYDSNYHNGNFDVSPEKIKKWWSERETILIYEIEFISMVEKIITMIDDSKLTYKSSKVTYLPLFQYLMKYPQNYDKLKIYTSNGVEWEYLQNGGQGTSTERVKQLEKYLN